MHIGYGWQTRILRSFRGLESYRVGTGKMRGIGPGINDVHETVFPTLVLQKS